MNYVARALKIGGAFIFLATLVATLLFAQGYIYDKTRGAFVKKGAVYFEAMTPPQKQKLIINGVLSSFVLPGEVRLVPGVHTLEIQEEGKAAWKKTVEVPEDTIVRFSELHLFPADVVRMNDLYKTIRIEKVPEKTWRIHNVSSEGLFAENKNLHYGKYFSLASENFWIEDIVIKTPYKKLVPLSQEIFFGATLDGRLFSFTPENRNVEFLGFKDVLDLHEESGRVYILTKDGKIYFIEDENKAPLLYAEMSYRPTALKDIQVSDTYTLIIFDDLDGSHYLVFTNDNQSITAGDAEAAYLEDETLYYIKNKTLFTYAIKDEKELLKPLPVAIEWFSRVGDSYHFLFLTSAKDLMYCDEDFENCSVVAKNFTSFIKSSSDKTAFVTSQDGYFTVLDFGESSFFQKLLGRLIPPGQSPS